jgi:hypothetical protein
MRRRPTPGASCESVRRARVPTPTRRRELSESLLTNLDDVLSWRWNSENHSS